MVKRIKGAFEIVAILVLSCLLLIGCLFALNFSTGNNSATINKSNVQILAEHEIIINGTNDDKANKWNEAIEYSISNDGVNVNVVLEDNWTAKDVVEAYHTSFGTGTGFSNGMILIPAGAKITLDLNGKVIDRRMTESTSYGLVIYVKGGELTILDSSCDNEDIIQKYNAVENQPVSTQVNAIKQIGIGKITGGASAGTGGGICVNENGILNFNGGMICDNTYAPVGGGIYAGNSEININGGIIMNNESKTYGGGISIDNCNLVFNGGIILGNLAKNDGGGIYATRSDITINNVIIASNFSYHNGGGLYLTGGDLE
ncbi:MAG: hypothetical protein K2P12_00575, partial [Clostridia bacterium]|nr:hypothetical protein [Clostridia bacterium]